MRLGSRPRNQETGSSVPDGVCRPSLSPKRMDALSATSVSVSAEPYRVLTEKRLAKKANDALSDSLTGSNPRLAFFSQFGEN